MSVLIKGMEMPESCSGCAIRYEMFCPLRHRFIADEGRRKDCPLVELPPHGDLIDRKAICLTDFEIAMCGGDYKEGMKMLLEKIESAPAIIPAEEGE